MRQLPVTATAILVAFTTALLSACGPDDSSSASVDQSNAAGNPATLAATPAAISSGHDASVAAATPAYGASATLAGTPDTKAASDSAVQSVEASLAGDSQQVAPVLRYAPGDSDQSNHSN